MTKLTETNIVVLGKGLVGSAWLSGFTEQKTKFANIADVKLVAVANSTRYLLSQDGLDYAQVQAFAEQSKGGNLTALLAELDSLNLPNLVVLDLTASQQVADALSLIHI